MSSLEKKIQRREMQGSGWILQGLNYLKIYSHKTNVLTLNRMIYEKFPIKINTILNIQDIETYCFLWSILASFHPVGKDPQHNSKGEPYRDGFIITNIDFTNGMNIVETPRFEKLNPTLAIIIFDYSSEEDNDYKSVPLNISKHNEKRRI